MNAQLNPQLVETADELITTSKNSIFLKRVLPIVAIHLGVAFAPFCFSVSGLLIAIALFVLSGLGVSIGLHRFLTHQSFRTFKWLGRLFATLGALAFQAGILEWVAAHRLHHAHADTDDDPHSPRTSFLWGHMLWLIYYDPRLSNLTIGNRLVKDLSQDWYLCFLEKWASALPFVLFALLYWGGEIFGPNLGMSWAVYGVCVRSAFLFQVTWLVNSASHRWGYQSTNTGDLSTNNWWVALLSFGEGWHNNHHAFPRSASFSRHWYQVDPAYAVIRALEITGIVWDVVIPVDETTNK